MKLKTVTVEGKTYAELSDGKPVYVNDNGQEVAFDAVQTAGTITRLNGEAKSHRERAEAAEAKLTAFKDIDPVAAKDALEKVANLAGKKLIEAGEKDAAVAAAIKPFEEKLAASDKRATDAEGALQKEILGGAFARSKFIADKIAIPADLVQSYFGKHFEVKDGKIAAKNSAGEPIFSPTRMGEPANFDEALEIIVGGYAQKDSILKGAAGGGGASSKGATISGGKTISRAEFDKLNPTEQHQKVVSDKVTIVD